MRSNSGFPLQGSRGPNWTPGNFQIVDMVAKVHAFHATFNVHRGFSDINLDLGPLRPASRGNPVTGIIELIGLNIVTQFPLT